MGLNGDNVIPQVKDESKGGQKWFKGWDRGDGYFTLESSKSDMVLTAISGKSLTIKGKKHKLSLSDLLYQSDRKLLNGDMDIAIVSVCLFTMVSF